MRTKVWTLALSASLLWSLCTAALGMIPYVVVMKMPTQKKELHSIQTRSLLDQSWTQLTLIPLKGQTPKLAPILEKLFPHTKFKPVSSTQEKRFLVGKGDESETYVAWFITGASPESTPDIIHTLYSQILPVPPYATTGHKSKTSLHPETQLTIEWPELKRIHQFQLSQPSPDHYTLIPAPSRTGIESLTRQLGVMQPLSETIKPDNTPLKNSPLALISKSDNNYLPIKSLLASKIRQRTDVTTWSYVRTLSSGTFGNVEVYQSPSNTHTKVVIKKLKETSAKFHFLSREAVILDELAHEHIIRLEGITQHTTSSGQELWLALEYFPNGDMYSLIKDKPDLLTEDNIQSILKGVTSAIHYLHNKNIVHRDLKPENILLALETGKAIKAKVADFGHAACTEPDGEHLPGYGTSWYAAPESLTTQEYPLLQKVDIWGIGVLAYISFMKGDNLYPGYQDSREDFPKLAIWRLQRPNHEIGTDSTIQKLHALKLTPPLSQHAENLIRQCCQIEPVNRPDSNTLIQHPFFSQAPHAFEKHP